VESPIERQSTWLVDSQGLITGNFGKSTTRLSLYGSAF